MPKVKGFGTTKGQHKKPRKRPGMMTKVEKQMIVDFVKDQPAEITKPQVSALATLMRRSTKAVKDVVVDARTKLASDADRYVDIHMTAAETALTSGDLDVARKASEWALANISVEGKRIVDKPESGPSGVQVFVGVKIGGIDVPTDPTLTPVVVEVTNDPQPE